MIASFPFQPHGHFGDLQTYKIKGTKNDFNEAFLPHQKVKWLSKLTHYLTSMFTSKILSHIQMLNHKMWDVRRPAIHS